MGRVLAIAIVALASIAATPTDDQIRDQMIRESIASYPRSCPCPYSRDDERHKCGERSAYSLAHGASPLCYRKNVSPQMIEQYRAAHSGN